MDYSELSELLRGRKTVIWTCNTCVRLCNGIGGTDAATRLMEKLRGDGIDVVGVFSTSASCLIGKVEAKKAEVCSSEFDTVLALTCNLGSLCAGKVFGADVVNPIETFGAGYLSSDGEPVLVVDGEERRLSEITDTANPFS